MSCYMPTFVLHTLGLLAQAEVPTGEAAPPGTTAPGLLVAIQQFFGNPINLILVSMIMFFLLVVRPQKNDLKRQQTKLAGLKKNDRIITSGGIHGVVIQANSGEPTVVIRIDENSGSRMTINRDAISKVIEEESEKKS